MGRASGEDPPSREPIPRAERPGERTGQGSRPAERGTDRVFPRVAALLRDLGTAPWFIRGAIPAKAAAGLGACRDLTVLQDASKQVPGTQARAAASWSWWRRRYSARCSKKKVTRKNRTLLWRASCAQPAWTRFSSIFRRNGVRN